jgi:uncharacterized protein (DUF362 family)
LKSLTSRTAKIAIAILMVALISWDIQTNRATIWFVSPAISAQDDTEPIRVDGLPIMRPGTVTLGEGHPTVAIAASIDAELAQPAPLGDSLSFEQVDAIVRRALDLDQSGSSLREVIEPSDEVLIKVNNITNRGNPGSSYFRRGFEHPGQITDLRVVKSVIGYLIDHVGPARITVVEGGSQSPRRDKAGFPTNATEDSWSVTYREFDDLSYVKILEEFADAGVSTVVDTADLNYASFSRKFVPGGAYQRLGVARLSYPNAQQGFHVAGTGQFRATLAVPNIILEADKVISLPAMKTHVYGTTLGIKNYVGTLRPQSGLSKGELFQFNPEHGQVDMYTFNPAAYTIIEGFWGTEGNGPQDGLNTQHNIVIVGSDPVATEAVANVTMGYNPLDLEILYLAAIKGFGTFDLERIQVVGRSAESVERNYMKSRIHTLGAPHPRFYGRGIRRWLVAGPFSGSDIGIAHLRDEANLWPVEGQVAGDGTWTRVEHLGYSAEVLDLGEVNGEQDDASHYAFTLVHSERQQNGFLAFGYGDVLTGDADGGDLAKIWLNGEVVYENHERHGFMLADTTFPRIHARLRRGDNRLLFKIGNVSRDAWMAAHVVDEDGDRLFGIEYELPSAPSTAVGEDVSAARPHAPALLGNYPNPFNPGTTIRFDVAQPGALRLVIFDAAGQRLRTLADGTHNAGQYEYHWDGRDAAGFNVASGAYFAVLQAGETRQSKMMTLIR